MYRRGGGALRRGVDVQRLCPPKWSVEMSIQAAVIPSDCDTRDLTLVRIMGGKPRRRESPPIPPLDHL